MSEQKVHSLLVKEATERILPPDWESGFYSQYFIVPRRMGGVASDFRSEALKPFSEEFQVQDAHYSIIMSKIRSEDWF